LLLPERGRSLAVSLVRGLVPCLGTALFLAVSLPRTAHQIMHLEHYQGGDPLKAFKPCVGLVSTLRSVVENLLLGAVGVSSVDVPVVVVAIGWLPLAVAIVWAWLAAPAGRRLMLLGAGLIFGSYLLVYSARADWGYEGVMNRPNWSR